MNTSIGQKIKKVRELRNYTQEYMAEKLGLSQNGYGKMEREDSDISVTRLTQIAEILEVNLLDLLTFDENKLFFNITHNTTGNGIAIYAALTDKERDLYEKMISQLKEENTFLKSLLER